MRAFVASLVVLAAAAQVVGVAARGAAACRGVARPDTRPVRADVDADGRLDRARIVAPRGSCPVLVVDGTRVGRVRAVVRQPGVEQVWPGRQHTPYIGAAALIDRAAGAELVVATHTASPTAFYAIFTLRGRRLVRYGVAHASLPDTFPSGGPATFQQGFDCRDRASGKVVTFGAQWTRTGRPRNGVGWTLYQARGTTFVRLRSWVDRTGSTRAFERPWLGRCVVAYGRPPRR